MPSIGLAGATLRSGESLELTVSRFLGAVFRFESTHTHTKQVALLGWIFSPSNLAATWMPQRKLAPNFAAPDIREKISHSILNKLAWKS